MFTIGEFSRFAQVTPDQLRHYDHLELFVPAYVDKQTGYRYYKAAQLPDLNRILSLKDLGLSLDQIKTMLSDKITTDEIRGILKHQHIVSKETIRYEQQRLKRVEARLRYLEQNDSLSAFTVMEKTQPVQPWLSIQKQVYPKMDNSAFFSHVYQACLDIHADWGGHYVCAMNGMALDHSDWSIGFTVSEMDNIPEVQVDGHKLRYGALPAHSDVASVVYNGTMEDYYLAYNSLASWIDDNQYRTLGRVYEFIYLMDASPSSDQNTIEVRVPIELK